MKAEIQPIIKDMLGNLTDSNNYRPITISTNIVKIFEYCTLEHLEYSLPINSMQFGFRRDSLAIMAVTVLKEVIASYNDKGSSVFTAFLDLSKTFNKVNHHILIKKVFNIIAKCLHLLNAFYIKYIVNSSLRFPFHGESGNFWRLGNDVR